MASIIYQLDKSYSITYVYESISYLDSIASKLSVCDINPNFALEINYSSRQKLNHYGLKVHSGLVSGKKSLARDIKLPLVIFL